MSNTTCRMNDDVPREPNKLSPGTACEDHRWENEVEVVRCCMPPRTRPLFPFASEYHDRGFAVIPLHGKRPALLSWKEFQARKPSESELREWFLRPERELNIGIVTGKVSDLVVVDADTPEDATWWLEHYPRSPLAVQTGGGGMHIYYRLG